MIDIDGTRASDDTSAGSNPMEIGVDLIPLDRDRISTRLRQDRRRALWPVVGLGCFLLTQIALLAPNILMIGRRFTMDEALKSDLRTATLVTSLVWIGIITTMIVAAARRRRGLARVIDALEDETRSPDAVCPECGGTPLQRAACCLRFPAAWTRADLNRFWHDRATLGEQATALPRGTPPTTLRQSIPARIVALMLGRRTTRTLERRATFALFATACIPVLFLARDTSVELVMIASAVILLLAIESISRLGESRRERADPFPRCFECDQRIDPGMGRCPECGTTARTGTVHYTGARGTPRPSLRVLLAASCMAIAFGLLFFAGDAIRFITGRLPNDTLVGLAAYDEDVFHPIWNEAMARPLDDIQSDRLFEVLISGLETGDEINSWHPGLVAVVRGTWPNGLDATQVDRIHAASWKAEVDAPATIAAGVPFDVTLVGERRAEALPFGQYLHVLFDGVSIDDGPFLHPDESMVWTLVANEGADQDPAISERRRFQRRITIDEPGPHRIRLAYRLVAGPGGLVDSDVDRDEFGESIPPATATWSRRFEIEQRIDVTD